MHKSPIMDDIKGRNSITSRGTIRLYRTSFAGNFKVFISHVISERSKMKYMEKSGKQLVDLTPKPIANDLLQKANTQQYIADDDFTNVKPIYNTLSAPVSMMSSIRGTRAMGGLKLTISDILEGMPSFKILFEGSGQEDGTSSSSPISRKVEERTSYIKVRLCNTYTIVLYEGNSETVAKDSDEAMDVGYDNKIYDYLTMGDGCIRIRNDAETQTFKPISLSRCIGPKHLRKLDSSVNASNFEVYDSFHSERFAKRRTDRSTNSKDNAGFLSTLAANENFSRAAMRVERALAINFHAKGQIRFRDLQKCSINDAKTMHSFQVNEIFRFIQPVFEVYSHSKVKLRKAVSDISFCFGNADLIAVGYGIFCNMTDAKPKTGNVCIWSIKNPHNPERTYSYKAPVTAVAFSPFDHSLIAVGTANGWVEVRDITEHRAPSLAIINKSMIRSEPIIAIKWNAKNNHKLLTLSLNADVRKFNVIKGSYLIGSELTKLDRVIAKIEGLPIADIAFGKQIMARRVPVGLNLTLDPLNEDIFYLLTNQGCIIKCSMTIINSYLSVLRTHMGAVNCMEFSPWSPKIFLTCGNDWHVRIWMDGITEPLLTLTHEMLPVTFAAWSPTHPTIILALNRKTLDIWDLKFRFKPVKSVNLDKSYNTLFKISPSGSSIMIGNNRGDVIACGLDNMPPQRHYQYDMLSKVLYDVIENENVRQQFKEAGFFGYKGKRHRRYFPNVFERI